MYKTLASTSLILLSLSTTAAAEGMAGLSLGQALYDDEALAAYALDAGGPSSSYKIFGGMALGSHLSAQAGLFSLGQRSGKNLGTYLVNLGNGTTETRTYTRSSARIEIDGFFMEGRWQWRAGASWRPYIKLGGALVNSKTDTFIAGTGYTMAGSSETHSAFSLVPGLGLVWESLHHWGLQLEAESYQKVKSAEASGIPDQNISNISLGVYGYW